MRQLISYIAPGAPATRRPASGDEPFLRPEIGFTPAWYRQHLDIDFGERFHTEPAYRRECVLRMRAELERRFPGCGIGGTNRRHEPIDLLTGAFGACSVAAIYGTPVVYAQDNWPNCAHVFLSDEQLARLEPPDLDRNPHFEELMTQVEWIGAHEGRVDGFLNWQGVLNNAQRLRGEQLLVDMLIEPDKARHLFACVCETMIQGIRRLHQRQPHENGEVKFVTASNCLVNLVSPELYADLLQPFDRRLASVYGNLGIHNCAWNATPYLDSYAQIEGVSYLDLGLDSDLPRARELFPHARRALMYTPMDAARKPLAAIQADFERIARDYAPCDIVIADIEAGTPDERVRELIDLCARLSAR